MTYAALSPLLAPLREEVELLPGPVAPDGTPTWTLHDPARHRFYRIDWPVFTILSCWHAGEVEAVRNRVRATTPLEADEAAIRRVERFLIANQLVQGGAPRDTARLMIINRAGHRHWSVWLLHHYLFFRIPLIHPDRWLAPLTAQLEFLFSPRFLGMLGLTLGIALLLLARQWELFLHSLIDTLTWNGLVGYGITLFLVKIVHELGHAVTAKRYGCRVPAMGVAFLVMWPMLYSDTTDTWRLVSRRQRIAVAAGGMIAEMMIAVIALFAWSFLPDGLVRQAAFMLCTTTLAATLMLNLSPFMRFDGYFILSDWLGMHNLHARSFELARWWMREHLFALGMPPPEPFSKGMQRFLLLFAWITWGYRLVVFTGIALLVYHFFTKLLGVLLFVVEIGWFIGLPVWSEVVQWWKLRARIVGHGHLWRVGVGLVLIGLLLFVPWQTSLELPGLLVAEQHVVFYPPGPARLTAILVQEGQIVRTGEALFELEPVELHYRRDQNRIRQRILNWEWSTLGVQTRLRERSQVLRHEIETVVTEGMALDRELLRYRLEAPFAGRVVDVTPDLQVGAWLGMREPLAGLLTPEQWVIRAYVDEEQFTRVQPGMTGRFHPETPDAKPLDCRVTEVDPGNTPQLTEPALASRFGGAIPVRDKGPGHTLLPEQSWYRLTLSVETPSGGWHTQRGHVRMNGPPEALAGRFWRALLAVLIRESGV